MAGSFSRIDSDFHSRGTRCAGWLYLPDDVPGPPPVVLMAHGFAAERTFRLPAYAERFVERGLGVFLFDYRGFGDSEGEPRQLVCPKRHLEDWRAAIRHVRALSRVDGTRMALWGSSFSGGHVIMLAAEQQEGISAIVAQVPFVDGLATVGSLGPAFSLRAVWAGLRDLGRMLTHRSPYYLPVVGTPEEFAVMNRPDCKAGYLALVPEDSRWRNACPARVLLTTTFYRPTTRAGRVRCPSLIHLAEKDSLVPAAVVEKAAGKMPRAELVRVPVGHFDVYAGETFEKIVKIEADFLERHLLGG